MAFLFLELYEQKLQQAFDAPAVHPRAERLLTATYVEMLAQGKVQPDDTGLPSQNNDPKRALMHLIGYLQNIEKDQATDFFALRINKLHKLKQCALPRLLYWQEGILPERAHKDYDLSDLTKALRRHMAFHFRPLPVVLAVQTLAEAINTGKALKPYLEVSNADKTGDTQPLYKALGQITELIELIGEVTGLPKQHITNLKNEILETGAMPVSHVPAILAKVDTTDFQPPCKMEEKPESAEATKIKACISPFWIE